MNFSVDVKGALEIDKFLRKEFPREVKSSMISALNKTNTTIKGKASKNISNASGIKPQKLIRQRVVAFKANKNRMAAGTKFRFNAMNAELIGKPKWNRLMVGAKVKGFNFPGSFTGAPKAGKFAGKTRIYRRVSNTGNPKADLRPERISLKPYTKYHISTGKSVANTTLRKEFVRVLKYRVGKRGVKI